MTAVNFGLTADSPTHRIDKTMPVRRRLASLPETLVFQGEFGEEINHFIPYVHWLYQNGELVGRRVATYAGMEPFYCFLDPAQLLLTKSPRRYVPPAAAPDHYLHRSGLRAERSGLEWAPDYRRFFKATMNFAKPILVIVNKFTEEWGRPPINHFDLVVLERIFSALKGQYQIIFFEAARAGVVDRGYSADHQPLAFTADVEVARGHPDILVFGDLLRHINEPYNTLKLKVFSNCHHFITTQGGNAHLCALMPGSLVAIQHTAGSEEHHSYHRGTFQFLANPPPTLLIGRNGAAMLDIVEAFRDCTLIGDRVHLGAAGGAVYRRYNPLDWRSVPVGDEAETLLPAVGL